MREDEHDVTNWRNHAPVKVPWWHGPERVLRRLGFVGPLAVFATVLPVLGGLVILAMLVTLGEGLRGLGPWGPWAFIGVTAFLGGMSLAPTHGLSLLGGYVFGFTLGLPIAMTGLVCAAALGFQIKSLLARKRVMGLILEKPESRAVHGALVDGRFWRAFLIVTLFRLSPVAPFAVTNLLMASTGVRWLAFLPGTAVGMLPRCSALVSVGALLAQLGPETEQTIPTWLIGLSIAATIAMLVLIGIWSRRALQRLTVV
jgi:phospholipase D1/2